ncbi:universal stress protein [Streptomyces sporangiiformans]|uniref:Universal stress protein n=1 Tax=Streptomyces sporangiiformans TaxID=2315329 RepID=A0A505D061_9ACTN|nr:universal stress protein [Streptomyces sporangiiformans]TPQ17743.1 universal stress protein [Streptomyces sporangiiformans]
MELPLVVGADGSEPSLRAVDWAAEEAALRGVPLRLVHASLWERYEGAASAEDLGKPSEEAPAYGIVDSAARRARGRQPDLKVSTEVVPDEPEYALVREGRHASALVLGTRGRGGIAELLLGSVSLTVAAHATCPVIVLRGRQDERAQSVTHHGRIVLGVGDVARSSAAVSFAFQEAERRGAVLEAVRAWQCPAHETTDHPLLVGEPAHLHERRAAEALEAALNEVAAEHPSVKVHRRTAEGPARKVLLDASATADLLVVGSRRQEGHFGLQLGRVAHTVLHHSACPIAVVPQRS